MIDNKKSLKTLDNKLADTPSIPDLRILPIDALLPHEEHDHQRAIPLIERIAASEVWLNPPIVTPIPDDPQNRYVILDGANRHYSLSVIGIPHILVQVVHYDSGDVWLDTWNHVLSEVDVKHLMPALQTIEGLRVEESTRPDAEFALMNGSASAYMRILPDQFLLFSAADNHPPTRTIKLREIVNIYKHIAKIDRINGDDPETIWRLHPKAAAVVIFARYQPHEIIAAAGEGVHLPPGISRHIIQGRAMRLQYPLSALRDLDTSLEDKNAALLAWMQERVANKALRLYVEATYIFDD